MSGPTASSYETSITVVSYLLLQYITPFIGIGIILYTLVTDDLQFLVVSSFITIPLIAAPLAYWLLEKQWGRTVRPLEFDRQAGDRLSASGVEDRLVPFRLPGADAFDVIRLGKCYVILYSISVVVAVVAETRPLVYVIVASAMGTVILIQSLAATTRTHRWLVLLEAGLFLGNVILTMTMKYHYFVGGTDLILHAEWAHHIVETGHSSEVMDVYEPYPLWHFVIAFVHMVFDGVLSTHRVMVLVSGLLFCLLPTAVYCIVKRIIRDDSISLLSGVFVSLNPIIVYYGMYATPRSIVSVLFAAFLFTCHVRLKWRWFGLLAVLTTALVLFHPASPPFVLAVLCLYGVFISLFHQYEFDFNWSFIAILVLITAFYWIYMTPGVVETFVGILEDSISPDGDVASSATVSEEFSLSTAAADLFNNGAYAVLLFLTVFGALEGFRSEQIRYYPVLITALVLIPLSVPGLSLLVPDLTTTLNFDRWSQYTYIFLACSSAVGCYASSVGWARKERYWYSSSSCSRSRFFSVGNIYVVGDNPIAMSETHTPYLTTEETTTLENVDEFSPNYVFVDYVSHRYLSTTVENSSAHILEADDTGTLIPRDETTENVTGTGDVYLFRVEELNERGLKIYYPPSNEFVLEPTYRDSLGNFRDGDQTDAIIERNDKVYDSGSTVGIYSQTGDGA